MALAPQNNHMTIKPFSKRLYVKISRQTSTKAGLALPDSKDFISEIAEVLAIGKDVKHFKVGDKILFKYWALDTLTIEDNKYDFIEEDHIIGTVS